MIVLDTHAWLWWVSEPGQLGRMARRQIEAADRLGVAAVSCFEVAAAVAKGRISLDRSPLEWLRQALAVPRVELLPLTPAVAPSKPRSLAHFTATRPTGSSSRRRCWRRARW